MQKLLSFLLLLIPIFIFANFVRSYSPPVKRNETVVVITPTPIPQMNEAELWDVVQSWKFDKYGYRYQRSDSLCSFALNRAEEIKTDFSHDKFDQQSKYYYAQSNFQKFGENLSRDIFRPKELLYLWLDSPKHKENLENDFTHSCIKCDGNYCVQIFGK